MTFVFVDITLLSAKDTPLNIESISSGMSTPSSMKYFQLYVPERLIVFIYTGFIRDSL